MRNTGAAAMLALLFVAAVGIAGQKATEIYIPIGMSPGISGTFSEIGEIVSYDADNRTLTLHNDGGDHPATLTDETDIWLDRSGSGDRNVVGTADELQPGRRCEVRYVYDGATRLAEAEWIKVEPGG